MTLDPFNAVSVGVGLVVLAFYFVAAHRSSNKEPTLVQGGGFFVGGTGIPVAFKLGFLALFTNESELAPFANEDRIYIILGAIALLWIFYEAVRDFLKSL